MAIAMATDSSNIPRQRKRTDQSGLEGFPRFDFHADGALAGGPIALCEVQAYVYAAKRGAAELARDAGRRCRGRQLVDGGGKTARQISKQTFWCEDLGTYALALDGDKRPCRVKTSNAGQCCSPASRAPERAAASGRDLDAPEMFSGWGVRTPGRGAPRYNPMSYHNGSIWPHDNALIAVGLARYGLKRGAGDLRRPVRCRLPYGHDALPGTVLRLSPPPRHRARRFIRWPAQPQAWASAAPFALLQAMLGMVWILKSARSVSTIRNCRHCWRKSASTTWNWRRELNLRLRRRGAEYRSGDRLSARRHRHQDTQ